MIPNDSVLDESRPAASVFTSTADRMDHSSKSPARPALTDPSVVGHYPQLELPKRVLARYLPFLRLAVID